MSVKSDAAETKAIGKDSAEAKAQPEVVKVKMNPAAWLQSSVQLADGTVLKPGEVAKAPRSALAWRDGHGRPLLIEA